VVIVHGLWIALALVLAVSGVADASTGPATERLKEFFGAVNVVIADPVTDDHPLEKLAAIRRLVQDIGDWDSAAARALGPEWKARSRAEQEEFVRLFADFLQRAFVSVMAGKARVEGGLAVTWIGERVEGAETFVSTTVHARSGSQFPVEYRMTRTDGDWRVRDVVVEGVSLVDNYRAQFVAVLRRSSYADLVAEMRSRASEGVTVAATPAVTTPVMMAAASAAALPVPGAPGDVPAAPAATAVSDASARPVATAVPVTHRAPAAAAASVANAVPAVSGAAAPPDAPVAPAPAAAATPAPVAPFAKRETQAVQPIVSSPSARPAAEVHPAPRTPAAPSLVAARAAQTPSASKPATPVDSVAPSLPIAPAVESSPRAAGLATAFVPRATVNTITTVTRGAMAQVSPTYWVQVGAFRSTDAAVRLVSRLGTWAFTIVTGPLTRALGAPDDSLSRVLVGPYTHRADAAVALKRLQASGVPGFITEDRH
jgi:phospholipid transport system substrate-binding protein